MQSEAERSLETILKDQPMDNNITLPQLLPQAELPKKADQIKKNISDFIQDCLANDKIVKQMIDRGLKSDKFQNQYQKNLALFSIDILTGDLGDAYKLIIKVDEDGKSIRRTRSIKQESQIEQEIQQEGEEDSRNKKYANFIYLLDCFRKPASEIPVVCMNYFTRIMGNIISSRVQEVYSYFAVEDKKRNQSQQSMDKKTNLQYLIEHCYHFAGVSEMLGKMLAEEGPANKFVTVKSQIVDGIVNQLKSEQLIKKSTSKYKFLLDFVEYALSRTKYKSDDNTDLIAKVCQRFVDQDVVWFFSQKAIRATVDSNNLLNNSLMNSSGTINYSQGSKKGKIQPEIKPENQEEFKFLQNTFQNSIQYLKILIDRLNYDEQTDQYSYDKKKLNEPTMDFQVNQALFGENSLYQMMTLSIPTRYKSVNKLSYYQFLLKLSRNSRYRAANSQNHMGLQLSFCVPILVHLLKTYRKDYKRNGLINFYVQELITQSILPKIQKLQENQAMMVISALNPTEQVLKNYDDSRAFIQKLILLLCPKCQWFQQHFRILGADLTKIKQKFNIKLGGDSNIYNNRKCNAKELQFIYSKLVQGQKKNQVVNLRQKSEKYQDDCNQSSSDDEMQKQKQKQKLKKIQPQEQLQNSRKMLQKIMNRQDDDSIKQQKISNTNVQQSLFKMSDENEIKQQIMKDCEQLDDKTNEKQPKDPKQRLMDLLVDSAGQQQDQDKEIQEEGKSSP